MTHRPTARQRLTRAGLSAQFADLVLNQHAHELAEQQREDIDLTAHPGEAIYPCEDCDVVRTANSIDPKVKR